MFKKTKLYHSSKDGVSAYRLLSSDDDDEEEYQEVINDDDYEDDDEFKEVVSEEEGSSHDKFGSSQDKFDIDTVKVVSKRTRQVSDTVSFLTLFRYCEPFDWLLIVVGMLAACTFSVLNVLLSVFYGHIVEVLVNHTYHPATTAHCGNATELQLQMLSDSFQTMDDEQFATEIRAYAINLTLLGIVSWIVSYAMLVCSKYVAERQMFRISDLFFRSMLRQDMTWHDKHPTGEFVPRLTDDLQKIREGIGEKTALFLHYTTCFLFNEIAAFTYSWKISLVSLSIIPMMIISQAIVGRFHTTLESRESKAYAVAGSIVEEVLSAIRTVIAFGGEDKEVKRYNRSLTGATKAAIKRGYIQAFSMAIITIVWYAQPSISFWYGVKLIVDERRSFTNDVTPGVFIVVHYCSLSAALNLGFALPFLEYFVKAHSSATTIFKVTDRVLNGVTFNISSGETVGLIGESGCGKSTMLRLLQRFYDPQQGKITVDGHDLTALNVGWLREHLGVVDQEPVLFRTTIAKNIGYGKGVVASEAEILNAAKVANVHDFVLSLPQKYNTQVGDRGTQLSGGQKQRVAIARALIRNPAILLLDEATSALDSESEAIVQAAMERARKGRTTIIVAHRLSTVRNADKIVVLSHGQVVEEGTHSQLIEAGGIYHQLITSQLSTMESNEENVGDMDGVEGAENSLHQDPHYNNEYATAESCKLLKEEDDDPRSVGSGPNQWKIVLRILTASKRWGFIVGGCIGAICKGASMPTMTFITGGIVGVLSNCDPDIVMETTTFYAYAFIVVGVIMGGFDFLQFSMFSLSGEYLTENLRTKTFKAILRQEIGWFDQPGNNIGSLASLLAKDITYVQGAGGSRLGILLNCIASLVIASAVALTLYWKLALVGICFAPLILMSAYLTIKVTTGQSLIKSKATEDLTNAIAIEAVSNIRTVASLHREEHHHTAYLGSLAKAKRNALRRCHVDGFLMGFTQSVVFFAHAVLIPYGGYLIMNETLTYENMLRVFLVLIYSMLTAGHAFAYSPNYNRGLAAARSILPLLERKSAIDSGLRMPEDSGKTVKFNHVSFAYPTRPDNMVLDELSMEVSAGQVVALVGRSGCGKSSCIQLLERFYDPLKGGITLDGQDICSLNIKWLRSKIGIVFQEPTLFEGTIAENIAYGDITGSPSMEDIVQAAMSANAHKFVTELPQGYETKVGDKGSQLSGGQKQRIAIARALIRKPKLLLLDEATSALDTENELVVQDALEKAQKGRMCIVVAHRLSSIRNANLIAVIDKGKIAELGTHDELMARRGFYQKYYQKQCQSQLFD